jgi:hypothetical protein
MKNIYLVLCCLCLASGVSYKSFAGPNDDSLKTGRPELKQAPYLKKYRPASSPYSNLTIFNKQQQQGFGDDNGVAISFTGNFRFHAMYRVLNQSYPNVKPKNLNIGGFGDGSLPLGGSPLLTLFSKIVPAEGVELGIGFGFGHIFAGTIDPDSTRSRTPFGQTFGGTASFRTKYGNIKIGGGNLYGGMSQLFSGWTQVRWNPFYRLPWDVSAQYGGSWSSYENTYTNGSVTNFDAAYASGGRTQGAIIQFSDLPKGFGLNLSYGVDGQTGLYTLSAADSLNTLSGTKRTLGGRAYRKVNGHEIGITGILNKGYVDNVSDYRESQYMYSGDATFVFPNITVNAEVGATAFTNPFGKYDGTLAGSGTRPWDTLEYKSGIDYLGQLRFVLKKEVLGIPLRVNMYNLGANYINLNSGAFNTSTYSNTSAYVQIRQNWDVAMRKGFIADLGQSANNRRAVEISTQLEKGRLKISLGTQVGSEIQKQDAVNNQVMFYHKLNPWSRGGFNFWTPEGGPYHRLLGNFIQLLEKVQITDNVVNYKKTFNVFDIDSRYRTSLFGRSLILTSYTSYQSASDKFSPLPYVTNHAFVRVFYEELITYYQLTKTTVIVGHAAYNKAAANNRTTLSSDNGKPINQDTWGFGGGIDWNFAPMMGIYFREMWMTHRDKNFRLDHFQGYETSLEIKVMF